MLNVHDLSVSFGGETLFEGISFRLNPGDRVGLIGKNGAGKTTTMRMIGTTTPRTAGELTVLGMEPRTQARSLRAEYPWLASSLQAEYPS